MGTWNYDLQKKAERAAAHIRTNRLQYHPMALQLSGPVPLFMPRDGMLAPVSLQRILKSWESDPESQEADWEFIRQMRRTDLPSGSFFVLIMPASPGESYHWLLHEEDGK